MTKIKAGKWKIQALFSEGDKFFSEGSENKFKVDYYV
ncbi:hypothetical protein FHS86_003427 [Roseimarinus sediminis]